MDKSLQERAVDNVNAVRHGSLCDEKYPPVLRRCSTIEVIAARQNDPRLDNTYEVHDPPNTDKLNNSTLLNLELPAPPPTAMSAVFPAPSSESSALSKKYLSQGRDTTPNIKSSIERGPELHKNISAVVKKLSAFMLRNPNEILPSLEVTNDRMNNVPKTSGNVLPSISSNVKGSCLHRAYNDFNDNTQCSIDRNGVDYNNSFILETNQLSQEVGIKSPSHGYLPKDMVMGNIVDCKDVHDYRISTHYR